MEQKKNKSLLLAGVITLAAGMFAACTEYVEDSAEFTTERIVINCTDSVTDASILPGSRTRSVFESTKIGSSVLTSKSGKKLYLSCTEASWPVEKSVRTRGAKVTTATIGTIGISASVYPVANSYTSAGCGSYFYKEAVTSGTPTKFYWPTSDYKVSFFAYYPYNNAAFTVSSSAATTGSPVYAYTVPSTVANQVDVMTAQVTNRAAGTQGAVALSFSHHCAAIKLNITNNSGSAITVNSVAIEGVEYSGTLHEGTWTLSGSLNSSSTNPFSLSYGSSIADGATADITGTSNIFIMLPQTLTSSAKLKIVTTDDTYETTISGSWVAGKTYTYSITKSASSIDLSMVDNAGNARASMSTANCYLVHAAGDYKLPLVYGNAIKDGAPNTVAFNPGGSASSTYTTQFVNHAGTGISGPWITKSGSDVNAGMGFTATSAELLWQDRSGLITSVSVNGDYLEFTVGSFGGGNALIAVKNGSTILWSWHIWVTTETLASTTSIATGSHIYRVAPVNLGWVPTGGGGKQGYCPYYQWGRKDPFIPSTGSANTNHTVYNISNSSVTGLICQTSTDATIEDNIKNPTTHYYNSSNYGPCNTTYYNMWDAQNKATNNVTSATKKTIYDPCPPGFCVPTGNLWYYFGGNANPTNTNSRSDSKWDSTNKGKTWTLNGASIYFPAAGFHNGSSGSLSNVGSGGYFWSASPYSTYYGRSLGVSSSIWYWSYTNRANGLSVRPVAEE